MTLSEIASATGFYKSTILRLAGSLERLGYLIRAESGVFRLGPAVWRLGSIYRAGFNLGEAIRPELRRLVEATGETASFYVREGQSRVCLFRHNSPHAARHHLDEGSELPLTAGASAHVLLAFSDGKGRQGKSGAGTWLRHLARRARPAGGGRGGCRVRSRRAVPRCPRAVRADRPFQGEGAPVRAWWNWRRRPIVCGHCYRRAE